MKTPKILEGHILFYYGHFYFSKFSRFFSCLSPKIFFFSLGVGLVFFVQEASYIFFVICLKLLRIHPMAENFLFQVYYIHFPYNGEKMHTHTIMPCVQNCMLNCNRFLKITNVHNGQWMSMKSMLLRNMSLMFYRNQQVIDI